MQRLKRAITSSYERWGRPLAEVPEALPQEDGDAKPAPAKAAEGPLPPPGEGADHRFPVQTTAADAMNQASAARQRPEHETPIFPPSGAKTPNGSTHNRHRNKNHP